MRLYLALISVFFLAVGAAAQILPLPTHIIINSQNTLEYIQDRLTAQNTIEAKAATISSLIGAPKGNLKSVGNGKGGFSQEYERATLYTERKSTTAYAVNGAILSRYLALGGPKSVLGFPTSDWTPAGDNRGWYNTFSGGGAIYWTPQTDAHEIHGNIYAQWSILGRERSWLGYPVTGEQPGGSGSGIERINAFEHGFATWNT
ncbi:LGFP repeat-domain-containing protein, partial [Lasiosphaeria hispida]